MTHGLILALIDKALKNVSEYDLQILTETAENGGNHDCSRTCTNCIINEIIFQCTIYDLEYNCVDLAKIMLERRETTFANKVLLGMNDE